MSEPIPALDKPEPTTGVEGKPEKNKGGYPRGRRRRKPPPGLRDMRFIWKIGLKPLRTQKRRYTAAQLLLYEMMKTDLKGFLKRMDELEAEWRKEMKNDAGAEVDGFKKEADEGHANAEALIGQLIDEWEAENRK